MFRPGTGRKNVAGPVRGRINGARVHLLGFVRLPDGRVLHANRWKEGLEACRLIRINGGNLKRGLMAWAMAHSEACPSKSQSRSVRSQQHHGVFGVGMVLRRPAFFHYQSDGQLWRTSAHTGIPDGAQGLYTTEQVRGLLGAAVTAAPVGPIQQIDAGMAAVDEGHDALCMAVLRGKACTCGVVVERGGDRK